MPKTQDHHLARIEELSGFAVAEAEPDVRGWEVIASDGQRIGVVEDLLVDTEDPRIRYLEVRLDLGLDDGGVRAETHARTIGESLVRDSLLDIENRMTAGEHPGEPARHPGEGGSHKLVPVDQTHLETLRHQVRLE